MEITSLIFAGLAITSVFIYYLLKHDYRVAFLTLLSCGFIITFSVPLLFYILFYSLLNYLVGIKIKDSIYKKGLFRLGIILNISQLFILRYATFAIDPIFQLFDINLEVSRISEFIIPIGISYFTLQGIGYLVNIKMGWEVPEKNFLKFLLYISFFPKFLSGPVERSDHFIQQLKAKQEFTADNVTTGLKSILWGFFKKVIIANHLAATINHLHTGGDSIGGYYVFLIILIQPIYLYFDFSGYTDIALGIARTFGIVLLPNFNRPFLSENMTNFWRRFHISLSSWFNDYIFKQVSFRLRRYRNNATTTAVFLTWILFGIWHGAGWNFMALGILQALAIYYEFKTKRQRNIFFSRIPDSMRIWTGRIFTYSFYSLSLTFFFSSDLPAASITFTKLIKQSHFAYGNFLSEPLLFGLLFAFIFLVYETVSSDHEKLFSRIQGFWNSHRYLRIVTYYAAILLILTQLDSSSSFIYEMF